MFPRLWMAFRRAVVVQGWGMDTHRPFTWADALAAGFTPRQLRGPGFVSPFRTVYLAVDVNLTPRRLAEAALVAVGGDAFICHGSAGILLGSGADQPGAVHLGVVGRDRPRVRGIVGHRYSTAPPITALGRLPVTAAPQTFLDLAASCSLVDLVTAADQFVAAHRTSPEQLVAVAARAHGRGAILAREAADLVRSGVESRMETGARLLIVLSGLPEPAVNLSVQDGSGRSRRLDLSYPELKIAVEYDGRHHIAREAQWESDLARREDLEALGWRFIVLTSRDLFVTPGKTVDRVVAALASRGVRVLPRAGWQLHFAGRGEAG